MKPKDRDAIDWPAPTLGQQSREVLRELLGLSEQELDELEREGVTGTEPALPSS